MPKRQRSSSHSPSPLLKRYRPEHAHEHPNCNYFDKFSDELVLKVLSFLPISDLARCQQVSYRFFRIAGDGQIWKSAFYHNFVRPRILRLRGSRSRSSGGSGGGNGASVASASDGVSKSVVGGREYGSEGRNYYTNIRDLKWLEDEGFSKATANTNWKKLYKLRYNWGRGICGVSEVDISTSMETSPSMLVKLRQGIVFTVDKVDGLRAWETSAINNRRLLAKTQLPPPTSTTTENTSWEPTAIAVDERNDDEKKGQGEDGEVINRKPKRPINISIGFESGSFGIYQLNPITGSFATTHIHHQQTDKHRITSMAFYGRNLAVMNSADNFSLYDIDNLKLDENDNNNIVSPRLMTTLKSHTVWPPHSLSIRKSSNGIYVSIVYALTLHIAGWSVGIQELRLSPDGSTILQSRIASAVPPGFSTCSLESPFFSQPTSFSYTHPYLLSAHQDNTLTLYLVKSTKDSLSITPGHRLWGHTSSVSGIQVGTHGKAVSISSRGSDVRIWDLEGAGLRIGRKSGFFRNESVKVCVSAETKPTTTTTTSTDNLLTTPLSSSEKAITTTTTTTTTKHRLDEKYLDRWLGFDEEKVIVHREKFDEEADSQVLMVYDFT